MQDDCARPLWKTYFIRLVKECFDIGDSARGMVRYDGVDVARQIETAYKERGMQNMPERTYASFTDRGDDYVEIENVSLKAHSSKGGAMLCAHDDWDAYIWIPYSQVHEESEFTVMTPAPSKASGTIVIKKWFALKENLIDED